MVFRWSESLFWALLTMNQQLLVNSAIVTGGVYNTYDPRVVHTYHATYAVYAYVSHIMSISRCLPGRFLPGAQPCQAKPAKAPSPPPVAPKAKAVAVPRPEPPGFGSTWLETRCDGRVLLLGPQNRRNGMTRMTPLAGLNTPFIRVPFWGYLFLTHTHMGVDVDWTRNGEVRHPRTTLQTRLAYNIEDLSF